MGVNLGINATDQYPYAWSIGKGNVASNGVNPGHATKGSFEANLNGLCAELLRVFAAEQANQAYDPAKYCAELHDGVKNLP